MNLSLAATVLSVALQNLSRVRAADHHYVNENSDYNDMYLNLDREHIVNEMQKPRFLVDMLMDKQKRRRKFPRRARLLAKGRGVDVHKVRSVLPADAVENIQDEAPDVGIISTRESTKVIDRLDTAIVSRNNHRNIQEVGDQGQERDCGWYPADVCQYCSDCDENGNYCLDFYGLDFYDEKCLGSVLDMCSAERKEGKDGAIVIVQAYFGAYLDYAGCPKMSFEDGYFTSLGNAYCEYFQCVADGGDCDDVFMDTVCEEMVEVCKEEHTFSCFWTQTPDDAPPCDQLAQECYWEDAEEEMEEEADVDVTGDDDTNGGDHLTGKVALATVALAAGGGHWFI